MRIQDLPVAQATTCKALSLDRLSGEKDELDCCAANNFYGRDDKRAKAAFPSFQREIASFDSGAKLQAPNTAIT